MFLSLNGTILCTYIIINLSGIVFIKNQYKFHFCLSNILKRYKTYSDEDLIPIWDYFDQQNENNKKIEDGEHT